MSRFLRHSEATSEWHEGFRLHRNTARANGKGLTAMAMNSAQIRHKNFKKLFDDFVSRTPNAPQRGMLKLFAERLNLSDRYLSHIKCNRKNIGNTVARTIEARLKLPYGWMDRDHDTVTLPADDKEKLFVETALSLFRSQPHDAREMMLDMLRQKLQVLDIASETHEVDTMSTQFEKAA